MAKVQMYDSADTSINSEKLPSIYGKLEKLGVALEDGLDYGCGKYFDSYGLEGMTGYDKYNYQNDEALKHDYSFCVCSNVLNVIMEADIRQDIMQEMAKLAPVTYITIYDGDKTGIGRPTKKSCWQENRKLASYVPEAESVFSRVTKKYGMLICER